MTAHSSELIQRIRGLSRPLAPLPASCAERLRPLPNIRAVFFDVYGTLFISGSGDIGVAVAQGDASVLAEALADAGIEGDAGARGMEFFFERIEAAHAKRRVEGIGFPEVDIRAIWREVLDRLRDEGHIRCAASEDQIDSLAVAYECRVNPVWPMPDAAATLRALRERGIALGIVSNAQFFTPLLFEALLDGSLEEHGFAPDLCIYSFEMLEAKPSAALHEKAATALWARHGLAPQHALYLGNDMLNDILPASRAGFNTALFAGDRRSLRLRKDDARCADVQPTVTLTRLAQLPDLIA